jgi:hypothetical protein
MGDKKKGRKPVAIGLALPNFATVLGYGARPNG